VQILHRFAGSIQQYDEETADPSRYRPDHCPQCQAAHGLTAHGFYRRTLVDAGFDGSIRLRRYLCRCCKRTVSLLPEFALPYLRFGISVIALFLIARLLGGCTLGAAATAARLGACRTSVASSGCAVSGIRPSAYAPRWQRWPLRLRRRSSSSAHCTCCSPSAGSPPIASCSPICGYTCWAGRRFSLQTGGESRFDPRRRLPEGPHTAFAWSRRFPWPYASGSGGHPHGCQGRKSRLIPLRADRTAGAGNAAPRRTHAPRRRDRCPPVRYTCFETHVGFGGHVTGLGAPVSQRWV
jgi:hypothetical protein